jgi:hypothetical protein
MANFYSAHCLLRNRSTQGSTCGQRAPVTEQDRIGGVHEETDSHRIDIPARRDIRGCTGRVEHRLKHFGSKLNPIYQYTADAIIRPSGSGVFFQQFDLGGTYHGMPPGVDGSLHPSGEGWHKLQTERQRQPACRFGWTQRAGHGNPGSKLLAIEREQQHVRQHFCAVFHAEEHHRL